VASRRADKAQQVPFRASPELMRLLRECAERGRRSLAEELRLAAEIHVTTALLARLADPDARAELGEDVDEVESRIRDKLMALAHAAYNTRAPSLLQDLIWINDRVRR
jgi:hypothetical protein